MVNRFSSLMVYVSDLVGSKTAIVVTEYATPSVYIRLSLSKTWGES